MSLPQHVVITNNVVTSLFKLFLGTELAGMSTFLLTAIGCLGGETGITFATDCLVTVKALGKHGKGWVIHSASESQDQVECRFLLDVVITQGPSILELFACEDETLLIRRDAFLVLDLCLDIINRIRRFHVESDCLARQRLDKDLHGDRVSVCLRVCCCRVVCGGHYLSLFDGREGSSDATTTGTLLSPVLTALLSGFLPLSLPCALITAQPTAPLQP